MFLGFIPRDLWLELEAGDRASSKDFSRQRQKTWLPVSVLIMIIPPSTESPFVSASIIANAKKYIHAHLFQEFQRNSLFLHYCSHAIIWEFLFYVHACLIHGIYIFSSDICSTVRKDPFLLSKLFKAKNVYGHLWFKTGRHLSGLVSVLTARKVSEDDNMGLLLSSWPVTCGAPHGFILSSILFNIHMK